MERANEQWERVRRYYTRFQDVNSGRHHDMVSDFYVDDILAFFQNCHHLKDWIKNDKSAPASLRADVEDYVDKHICLRICADLCNGLKHLAPNRNLKSGAQPELKGRTFGLRVGALPNSISVKQSIEHNGQVLDAFELAMECMSAWELFINRGVSPGVTHE